MSLKKEVDRVDPHRNKIPTFCPTPGIPSACIFDPDVGRKVRPIEFTITEGGCWLVLSHTAKNGHGKPVVYRKNKSHLLSRYLYELKNGPIRAGMILVQTCETDGCCAPEHHVVQDRGYFNTFSYMLLHNEEHYINLCKANRSKKMRRSGKINYDALFRKLALRFQGVEREIRESPIQRFFPSELSESEGEQNRASAPFKVGTDFENQKTKE